MHWVGIAFGVLFAAGWVVLFAYAWRQEKQNKLERGELLLSREAQRRDQPLPPLTDDPDYQRLCRALAEVIRESVGSPDLKLDPTTLRPTDVWWGELDFDLDSLAHCELVLALEKEFHCQLKWRQFQEAVTILDVYQILFPDRGVERLLLKPKPPPEQPPEQPPSHNSLL